MQELNPDRSILVIVPTFYLKQQWEKRLVKAKIKAQVVVVNTAIKNEYDTDLVIIDEAHRIAAPTFIKTFEVVKYRWILCLTATLERQDQRNILIEEKAPVLDDVTLEECLENGYVSNYKEYFIGIDLKEDELATYNKFDKDFNKYFSMFGYDFNLAMGCLVKKDARQKFAKVTPFDESQAFIFAVNFNRAMQGRKKFIHNFTRKLDIAKDIVECYEIPAITFWQSIEMADKMTERIPYSVSYHSKMKKKEKVSAFNRYHHWNSKVKTINTANSLDEGADVGHLKLGVEGAYDSSKRKYIQRLGRVIRKEGDQLARFFVLYLKNTQEEKWLRGRVSDTGEYLNEEELYQLLEHERDNSQNN